MNPALEPASGTLARFRPSPVRRRRPRPSPRSWAGRSRAAGAGERRFPRTREARALPKRAPTSGEVTQRGAAGVDAAVSTGPHGPICSAGRGGRRPDGSDGVGYGPHGPTWEPVRGPRHPVADAGAWAWRQPRAGCRGHCCVFGGPGLANVRPEGGVSRETPPSGAHRGRVALGRCLGGHHGLLLLERRAEGARSPAVPPGAGGVGDYDVGRMLPCAAMSSHAKRWRDAAAPDRSGGCGLSFALPRGCATERQAGQRALQARSDAYLHNGKRQGASSRGK